MHQTFQCVEIRHNDCRFTAHEKPGYRSVLLYGVLDDVKKTSVPTHERHAADHRKLRWSGREFFRFSRVQVKPVGGQSSKYEVEKHVEYRISFFRIKNNNFSQVLS